MTRFQQVIGILDASIGGPEASIRAHGTFWRDKTRDELVALKVFDVDLLVVGQGEASNLVKSLKGEAPFDGTEFPRMPAGRAPVAADDIAFIEKWIDDGCPDDGPPPPNGQPTWRPTNAPMADQTHGKRYDDIWFLTPEHGWGVNSDGKILRTRDGGATWEEQFHNARTYLRCVGFATETRGWAGTLSGPARLYETSDGGATWTPVTLPAEGPKMICGMSVVNESVIYASGTNYPFPFQSNDPPAMMKSVDGGATWTGWDMTAHAALLVDTLFTSPERGWVVGGFRPDPSLPGGVEGRDNVKPVVLYTADGGKTWINRVANIEDELSFGEWGWKIQFLDDQVGFVTLENFKEGAILMTSDGGRCWRRMEISDPQHNANLEGVGFVDRDHGWVGGWGTPAFVGGQSSATDDGGATWRDANEIGRFINRFRFFREPATLGYAAGATVYKYSAEPVPPPKAVGLEPPGERLLTAPGAVEDGMVRFPVTVPEGAPRLVVNVWERFGHHVRELLDEADPAPGPRTLEWDVTDGAGQRLPPGSFVVRVTVDDHSESQIIHVGG